MRLNRFALLITATSIAISGCAASRSASSPAASDGRAFSAGSEYDVDPPMQQNRSRMAIQPSPVPPAQGVSHVRGVSFLTVLKGKHSGCAVEPGCEAPCEPQCVEDAPCGDTGCGDQSCWNKLKFRLPKLSCPSWLKNLHHKDTCCNDPDCTAPGEVACVPETSCGERSFFRRPTCLSRLFCPPRESACVPEAKCCEESYCQPLVEAPCGDEGCSSKCGNRYRRFFTSLTGKMKTFSLCRRRSNCGEGCRAQHPQGCGSEGCCVDFGRRIDNGSDTHGVPTQQHDNGRPQTPLAAPLADPFVESDVVTPPPTGVPDIPRSFEPHAPSAAPDVPAPPQPVQPNNAAPLNPVPDIPNDQVLIDPQVWPKLKADAPVPRRELIEPTTPKWVDRQWSNQTHPTGWRRS